MPRLTKRVIDSWVRKHREATIFDSEIPGFGIHARPSGHCSFILQYRNSAARSRKLTIGVYPRLTVDQARRRARQERARIDRGEDPGTERDEARRALTVADLAQRYLTDHLEPRRKPSTVAEFGRVIARDIVPKLGRRRITTVTMADIDAFHRSMKHSPTHANRTLAILSSMFTWAEKWELKDAGTNPCRHVERFPESSRERFLSGLEMARLGEVLRAAEDQEHESAILAIRLLLLTGMRRGEVLSMQWDFIDFENAALNLPDSKTGKKRVFLPPAALQLLNKARHLDGNRRVCWGLRPGRSFVGLQKVWERVRHRAELADVRLHDLRHSFASVGAASGEALFILGKVLGHADSRTTERYTHLADDSRKAAVNRIGSTIGAAMDGRTPAQVMKLA